MHELARIVDEIRASRPPGTMTTRVVAVDGLGGAGKSTLARHLAQELGGVQIVQTDDFASWEEPLEWWPRLIADVLEPLARNEPARYRRTDWGAPDHDEWGEVVPAEFVVLEGVSSSRRAFRPYLAYAIWVDTHRDVRLRRGLERDGADALPDWERWMAQEDAYVEREHPHELADAVVSGD